MIPIIFGSTEKKKDLFNKNLTAKEYFAAMKGSVELWVIILKVIYFR